ncbi:hypothetical protein I3843_03G121000 [Carya illinoinensis]|nr:hypothetical protein I3843_03G121000 [Carya illinoinensis]
MGRANRSSSIDQPPHPTWPFCFYFLILFIFFFFFFFLLVEILVLRRREILNLHSFHSAFTPPLLRTRAPLAQLHPDTPLPLPSTTSRATPLPIPRMPLPLSSATPHLRFIKCVTVSDGAVGKTRYEASHLRYAHLSTLPSSID